MPQRRRPASTTDDHPFPAIASRLLIGLAQRIACRAAFFFARMSTYPKSPREQTRGMAYFPRMLDKIRLHARGELGPDYHRNLGRTQAGDGRCCNFLRVKFEDLRERVLQGGTDEEILEWCFETGRRLSDGDLIVWNGFITKLGWRDHASDFLAELKTKEGLENQANIQCMADLIDFD